MPLVVVSGKPASGKSTIADRIREHLNANGFHTIVVISDKCNSAFNRSIYSSTEKEREHRAVLRSEIQRVLTKECIVICDSMNSIKGFRYELYCVAKLVQTTFTIVYCDADHETRRWLNSEKDEKDRFADILLCLEEKKYEEEWMDDLEGRYEEPNSKNRWDSPLFKIKVGTCENPEEMCDEDEGFPSPLFVTLPFDDLISCIVQGKNLAPNSSTKVSDGMSQNAMYSIDKITREVVDELYEQQRTSVPGGRIMLPSFGEDAVFNFTRHRSVAELSRVRRKFINYVKSHPIEDRTKILPLFVEYLNNNC